MKLKKIIHIIVVVLIVFLTGCPIGDPAFKIDLPVSYFPQEYENWCGLACIQMWADFDGNIVTQGELAVYTGSGYNKVAPQQLVLGVSHFTNSEGYLAVKDGFEAGAKGDLIGATITGIKNYIPSIMPIYEEHAILIKGYKWIEDEDDRHIGQKVFFHDPDGRPAQSWTVGTLETAFMGCPINYWVIIGRPYFLPDGIDGHDEFVLRHGVYYGGPLVYDPKEILDPPPPVQ